MNHVSKIIIIIKKIKKRVRQLSGERERVCRERFLFLFFLLFFSFSDLRKLDRRFSSELKAKLIHAARATHEYQNLGVSSNSTR